MDPKQKDSGIPPIKLDVLDANGNRIQSHQFLKEKIVIGRILSADVRIDDLRVSRIHALIECRDDGVMITDLASSHGTFLNGKKIVESKLKWGDKIRIGIVELSLQHGSGEITEGPSFEGRPVYDSEATMLEID